MRCRCSKRRDRRVERTRQLLETALLAPIKEKEFDTISVQEIIDRANVGRATFYSQYDNKEDLLESGFDGLLAALRERECEARERNAGMDENLFAFGHHLLRRLLLKVVREDVRALALQGRVIGVPEEALVEYIAGGLFGLMMWWLSGKTRLSIDQMDDMFLRLALAAFKAAVL